ncbi:MAG: Rha family transcriptional regulator [Bacteroidales bacterium]
MAEVTGKGHNDILKSIRNMETAWTKITKGNFSLSEYRDTTGRQQPMYKLTKTECLYIATKFNDEARAKLIVRWKQLEKQNSNNGFAIPQNFADALRLAASQAEQIEEQQSQIGSLEKETREQAPKELFAKAVETSNKSCLVGELAKVLKQNGVEIGRFPCHFTVKVFWINYFLPVVISTSLKGKRLLLQILSIL